METKRCKKACLTCFAPTLDAPVSALSSLSSSVRNSLFGYGMGLEDPDPKTFLVGNRLKVYRFIESNPGSSTGEIAIGTGLSKSVVRNILNEKGVNNTLRNSGSSKRVRSKSEFYKVNYWSVVSVDEAECAA